MIHFMTDGYVFLIERGLRTIETVPEFDPRNNSLPVRKCVKAAIAANKIKTRALTFAEVCGEEGTTQKNDPFYGVAKDDKELKDFVIEYAAAKKIKL